MKVYSRVYITAQKFLPRWYVEDLQKKLLYASIEVEKEEWAGLSLLLALMGATMAFFLLAGGYMLNTLWSILGTTGVFVAILYLMVAMLQLISDRRVKQIESSLPDALRLIGANIKAGITPDKALFLSARPEFGVLNDEIRIVGEQTIAGKDLATALQTMADRNDSRVLTRVVDLIKEGMDSGGEIASLLDRTADDIHVSEILNQEIQSNVGTYAIFMMLAIMLAAPILYSTSISFVELTSGIKEGLGLDNLNAGAMAGANIPFIGSGSSAEIDFGMLKNFAMLNLAISCFFGSLLLGVLRTGEERNGFSYIPLFMVVAFLLFFISSSVISGALSGLFSA